LGLALVAGWVAISAVGLVNWHSFRATNFFFGREDLSNQLVASLVSTLLIGIVPLGSAAWALAEYRRHRAEADPRQLRRPLPIAAIALLAAALVLPLTGAVPVVPPAPAPQFVPTRVAPPPVQVVDPAAYDEPATMPP